MCKNCGWTEIIDGKLTCMCDKSDEKFNYVDENMTCAHDDSKGKE